MLAEKSEQSPRQTALKKWLPWLNLGLTLLLILLGLWFLAGKMDLAEIAHALIMAKPLYIALGVLIVVVTVAAKAWRWQYLLRKSGNMPNFMPTFWATVLGQYVNFIVPFLRLGEVARVYALNQQTQIRMGRALGTLVVEKTLDLIFFAITIVIVLPFIILPDFLNNSGLFLGLAAFVFLILLYLLAYHTERLSMFLQQIAQKFPLLFIRRIFQFSISGLEGLAALRSRRLSLILIGQSIIIALLSILLPYVLFYAFDLNLGLVEATLVHIAASIAAVPPSTPAKIGVLNGAVVFTLYSLDLNKDAAIIGYGIVFHLVAVMPQIFLGIFAAWRTNWKWQHSVKQTTT